MAEMCLHGWTCQTRAVTCYTDSQQWSHAAKHILSASSEVICHDALTHPYFELFTPHYLIVCAFYAWYALLRHTFPFTSTLNVTAPVRCYYLACLLELLCWNIQFFINRYREKYTCSEGACTWDISKEHYFSFVKTKVYLHHAGWPS